MRILKHFFYRACYFFCWYDYFCCEMLWDYVVKVFVLRFYLSSEVQIARVSRAAPTQHTHYKLGDLGFSKKYVKSLGADKYACFCEILTILRAIGAVPSSPNHGISKKTATAQKLVKV